MRGRFMLTISLGNEAMSEPEHIGDTLRRVGEAVDGGLTKGPIRDANGNTVGFFDIEAPGSPES